MMKKMGSSDRNFDKVKENNCANICEIGTFKGGTLFLFCQAASPDAKLISIDTHMPPYRRTAYKKFARRSQKVYPIEGDSKADSTFNKVQSLLKDELLDFLFIDGDHSYEGVKNDFYKYSVLVKKGGFIAFNDIVEIGPQSPDRFYVGGVPIFWQEVKETYRITEEFVHDPYLGGFGIGVLTKDW